MFPSDSWSSELDVCIMAHMFARLRVGDGVPCGSCAALAALVSPAPSIAQTPRRHRPQSTSAAQDDPALRFRMPTVTVTAQKEPEDKQKVPVSVTAVSQDDDRERRHPHRQRRGDLRAEHLLHRVDGAEAEQRALPRHQLQPEQPGHHHLHRRRAAAERELVEHRAARRRSDRVRARSAERALRPEHARRAGEHHEQPAVAVEVDGRALGAVRQPRVVGGSRRRVGTGRRATS